MSDKDQENLQQTENKADGEAISFTSDGKVKSRRYSKSWDFSGSETVAKGKKAVVSFTKTKKSDRQAIQDTLAELYHFHKDKDAQAPTSGSLRAWKRGLEHIANALGSTEWTKIDSRQGFRTFKLQLKALNLGKKTITNNVVVSLNKLFENGFVERIVEGSVLADLGNDKGVKQYMAIPIGMYQQLLGNVIAAVDTYHPYRNKIARVLREADDIKTRVDNGENVLKGHRGASPLPVLSIEAGAVHSRVQIARKLLIKHNIPDFGVNDLTTQLGVLQSSCAMVLLAFSGTRIGEMISFNKDSYQTIKMDGGKEIPVLHGETSKGSDGKPKPDTWQTHLIAKDTLELAYDMTEPLREGYKVKIESMFEGGEFTVDQYQHALKEVESAFVPCDKHRQQTIFVASGFARKLNVLMKAFDIRATEEDVDEFNLLNPSIEGMLKVGGYLPKLTPHDLRRTFAVFFKRYGFGGASGIKFQYKHTNINMSDYYANNAQLMSMHDVLMDDDLLQMMEEEDIRLGIDIYDDIYNGSEHLSGVGGERIAQDKFKKMKAGHEVYMARSEIEILVRNGSLAAVQLPTGGYCTNGECERICGMGLFIGEKKSCIHKVVTDKEAKNMARQRKRLIDKFQGFNSGDTMRTSILVGLKQKIKEIEVTLVTHGIKHEAFEDKVRGLIDVRS